MAFPSVVTPRGTSGALASSASHSVAMPASASTARGVLVVFTADGGPTLSTGSSGWSKIAEAFAGSNVGSALFYKRPGATLASLTVTQSFAEEGSYVVLVIDGAASDEDPTATSAIAATANGNPPAHNPAGGARDYLWIAAHCNESLEVATSGPAGYSGFTATTGGPSGASTATAERALNAASENPGAFTNPAENHVSWTIAVPPGSSDQSVTMTAGIPTGEAFGAGSVTAGAVSATAPSIGSAEAFGSSMVSHTVSSPSIPTAEAFGAGELNVVGVITGPSIPSVEVFGPSVVQLRNLGSPSIPSAEAFGAGAVAAGPVSVASASIPSAESFGPHLVSITIYSLSIPSALVIDGGSITVGPVSIFSVSIPSAESFGDSEVTVTLDPTKRIRPVRVRLAPLYEVLVVARIPAQAGPPTFLQVDPIDWSKITWSATLSRPQTLSVTCRTATITEPVAQRLRTPDRLPTELWVSRNGRTVFAGPLLGGSRNGYELTLQCGGLLTYLHWMIVTADLRFDQVDQFGIASALIDQWQALDFGHFGIDTTTVGASGVLRDRSYVRDEIHQVARRVEELGAVRDGFDTEVDPTTRKLQLWYPGKGIDRSTGDEAIVFDARAIDDQNAMFSIAPGDLASDAFGSGSKAGGETPLWSTQFNADLRAAFGRAAVSAAWSDVEEQGTLDDHVGALLDARDQPLRAPGQKVRVPADADLDAYDVGDTVSYELDDLLGIGGAWRIRSRTVTVETTGTESVDLEFV